jgi:hypothetical protein
MQILPSPTDEEAVAIAAAIEFTWPRPQVASAAVSPAAPGAWRFSGRWWNGALPLRQQRS